MIPILVVEDDNASRVLMKKQLEAAGHRVLSAQDGHAALDVIRDQSVSLIITDWQMPKMDGLALCRHVRNNILDTYIYIILVTARTQKHDLVSVFEAGADDYIPKPVDIVELKARVQTGFRLIALERRYKQSRSQLIDSRNHLKTLNDRFAQTAAQLETKNQKLENTLQQLADTQAQMLHSEKMASIGQLAAGVAHEINNPTGFVSSNINTLGDYSVDLTDLIHKYQRLRDQLMTAETQASMGTDLNRLVKGIAAFEQEINIDYILSDIKALIGDCVEGTERIKKIVMDLKDFAHPGNDEPQMVDLNAGLDSTLNLVHNEIKYKADVYRNYGEIPALYAYPHQLNQVFMNILVNAAQAIEKEGTIQIATRFDGKYVEVVVTDNGCGIPVQYMGKIFDPFFTTKEVGKGTGLGMHLAYNIIKKHGGTIAVESEIGKGSTFTVRIPTRPPAHDPEFIEDRPQSPPSSNVSEMDARRFQKMTPESRGHGYVCGR